MSLTSRDKNSKKRTYCLRWGTSAQKVIGHFPMFCPMAGQPRGHFPMLEQKEGNPRGNEGTLSGFVHTPKGTSPCFFYQRGIQESTFATFFLILGHGQCPPCVHHCIRTFMYTLYTSKKSKATYLQKKSRAKNCTTYC